MARSNVFWKLATLLSFGALAAALAVLYRQRQAEPAAATVTPIGKHYREAALDRGTRNDKPIVLDISDFAPIPDPEPDLRVETPKAPAVAKHSSFPTPKFNEHHHHH